MKRDTIGSAVFFAGLLAIGLITAAPLFADGLPTGGDSMSHLFKVLYSYKALTTQGGFPAWCSDWYGGTPFLHFYPPGSYLLAVFVAFLGVGPVLAYNGVNAFFYIVTPFAVYYLSRSLGFQKGSSLFAGLLFSLTPVLLENFLFYDRFTTTVSVPLLCLFLVCVVKALPSGKNHFLVAACLLMTLLLLIHHLTAYSLGLFLLLFLVIRYLHTRDIKTTLKIVVVTVGIPVALSAFWLLPFLESTFRVENPFYNRSNVADFLAPEGFMSLVVPLGLQFLLAMLEIARHLFPSRRALATPRAVFKLLFPSSAILLGSVVSVWWLELGQILLLLGFTAFLLVFADRVRAEGSRDVNYVFCVLWFISLLWLSVGFSGVLFRLLPFSQSLDVLRFRFYLAIPQSLLAGNLVYRLVATPTAGTGLIRPTRFGGTPRSFLILILLISAVAVCFGVARDMTYPGNTAIPSAILEFSTAHSEGGRVLPILCPDWIYVLPYYTDQPLIDGWYPQEKLLSPLLAINDYKINDLYSTLQEGGAAEQDRVWLTLIRNAPDLGISWVMIGDDAKRPLMQGTDFTLAADLEGIAIYRAVDAVSLVEASPRLAVSEIEVTQRSSDHLTLRLEDVRETVHVVVKVADFPGWTLRVDGVPREHARTEVGFIAFSLPPQSSYQVDLTYDRLGLSYLWLSLVGVLLLAGLYGSSAFLRQ
jgi:hypothetical protein